MTMIAVSAASTSAATSNTEVFYPPASSNFALPVPAIIGVVIAGVGFLVLLAITAALVVFVLDRKKETGAGRKERKKEKAKREEVVDAEDPSMFGSGIEGEDSRDANPDVDSQSGTLNEREAAIGPRYARAVGLDTIIYNANTDTVTDTGPGTDTRTKTNAIPQATKSKSRERDNKPEKERTVVHLPVHVSDLGTPRQSEIHYEREDPGDEDRDERGYRRGASWWHPS